MEQFVVMKNGLSIDNMTSFKRAKISFTSQRNTKVKRKEDENE
jgi:hypothetical protein